MKSLSAVLAMIFLFNLAHAQQSSCQQLIVPETSNVTITLLNTAHDRMGAMDEIRTEVSSSEKKLIEEDMLSDFFGSAVYKQGPLNNFGIVRTDVAFNTKAAIFNKEVKFDDLYNKHLNILITDEDAEVPLASGSIEMPFYLLSGGNHDDLIFSLSKKLKIQDLKGTRFSMTNDQGDQIEVSITTMKTKLMNREELKTQFSALREQLDVITKKKESMGHSHEALILDRAFSQTLARAIYVQDLLQGKITGSCQN